MNTKDNNASESTRLSSITDALAQIEQALDSGSYRKGGWQRLLSRMESLPLTERQALAADLNRVSDKLHGLNGFLHLPVALGIGLEMGLLLVAVSLLNADYLPARVVAIGALALCLQPSIKLAAGLLLGVRYSYVYLWYFEPRFKMRFGTYMALPRLNKVIFQLTGSVGTPIAMLMGWVVFNDSTLLSVLSLAGAMLAALMQVAAFVAAWRGVRKVGPFLLTNLTTPATAARELKALLEGH